jgi:penicillin-binding protein 1A
MSTHSDMSTEVGRQTVSNDFPEKPTESHPSSSSEPHWEPVPDSIEGLRQKLKARRQQTAASSAKKPQSKLPFLSSRPKSKRKSPSSPSPLPPANTANRLVQLSPQAKKRLLPPLLANAQRVFAPFQIIPKIGRRIPGKLRWGLGITGGLAILAGGSLIALDMSLPDTENMAYATAVRSGTVTFKALNGDIFFQSGPATRNYLKIADIPEKLQQAYLATEDRRFYEHRGVDVKGIARAVSSNILSRGIAEGGSTLTQQLARISYLNQERSILRKIREARLAQKIEEKLSKSEILERYLNQVYLGGGAYGVGDAAEVYFSKPVKDLKLGQMAVLAGLPAAPTLYSPSLNPETAKKRRNEVLDRMVRSKFITAAEAETAKQQDLEVKASSPPNLEDKAPYFSSYLKEQLSRMVPEANLKAGGITVETTLNLDWQKAATRVVEDTVYLDGYNQGFGQAALVSLEPQTGEIRAMVGGASFNESQFNRVTQALRQPGSTFKAFVYAAAIAAGMSPYDSVQDIPFSVDGYKPKNYSRNYSGWVTRSQALSQSLNIPAVRTLIEVGFDPMIQIAKGLGIQSKLDPFYSTALGGNEVTVLELTNAYGTLAAQGFRAQPHGIRRIFNRTGRVIYGASFQRQQALDSSTANIMNWMLQQVVDSGTGTPAQLNRPVAGKTGTSEQARDLWFVGYVPQLVTGVWLGNDDNYPTGGSSSTAAFVWREFMKQAVEDIPVQKFPELPQLEGRKASIKANPVKPNSMYNISPEEAGEKKEQPREEAPPPEEEAAY